MSQPPLKVWIITLSIFCVIFLTTLILAPMKREYLMTKPIKYAFDNHQSNPDGTKVVFIGSSLLSYALVDDSSLKNRQLKENSSSIDLIKIGIPSAVLEDFLTNEYLVGKLKEQKPGYILIQESILQRVKKNKIPNLKSIISLREMINMWNGTDAYPASKLEPQISPQRVFADSTDVDPTARFDRVDPETNSRLLVNFIRNLDDIPIIIVEVPVPMKLEKAREAILKTTNYESVVSDLKQHHSVHFLEYDYPFHYRYFFDDTHMNERGREKYTDWLLGEMNKIVTKDHSTNE